LPAHPAGRTSAAHIRCAATALAAQAWQTGVDEAAMLARSALARLRDRLDAGAVAEICALAPVDAADGSRVVAAAERAGAFAVAASQLFHATDVWRLSPPLLDQLLAGPLDQADPGPARPPAASAWEPFLAAVTCANGQVTGGEPASAGLGAGRLLMLGAPQRLAGVRERWVLHVEEPLPAYAPLLWGAAGLVSATGSASAHLFDVARALGVPAVAGTDLPDGCGRPPVVAVDGSAGQVYVL
jgi:phosphohistidine swiveling domain-containing protein